MNLVKALRGELLDCNCCAYSRSECCCDTTWPEEVTREAADQIERLTAELAHMQTMQKVDQRVFEKLTETRDLAEHWAILAEQRRVELGECRKDAERYGWVVLNADPIELYGDHPIDYETSADPEYKRQFDAAIDRAMEKLP